MESLSRDFRFDFTGSRYSDYDYTWKEGNCGRDNEWDKDGECDVPAYCMDGTDVQDCADIDVKSACDHVFSPNNTLAWKDNEPAAFGGNLQVQKNYQKAKVWSEAVDSMLDYLEDYPSKSVVEAIDWYVVAERGIVDKNAQHAETETMWMLMYETMAAALLLPPLKDADKRDEYFKLLKLDALKPIESLFTTNAVSVLVPDWFKSHNRYEFDSPYFQEGINNTEENARTACRWKLESVEQDRFGRPEMDFLTFDRNANHLRRSMVSTIMREERGYLSKSFAGPTCGSRECRDTVVEHSFPGKTGKKLIRQGMRELTRKSKDWEKGVYQRWFSYQDDVRYWKDHLHFMNTHGNSTGAPYSHCLM
jgi:hypothetical protein